MTTRGNCAHCHRPMRDRNEHAHNHPGTVVLAAGGKCRRCYYSPHNSGINAEIDHYAGTPERETTPDSIAATRRALNTLLTERRARHIPWCGTEPTPAVFKEERRHPGTHRLGLAA